MKAVALAADGGPRLLNPYLRIIFGAPAFTEAAGVRSVAAALARPEVRNLHLHWPEYPLHGPLSRRWPTATEAAYRLLATAADRVRARGGRVVWTAHNLAPHGFPSRHGAAAYARWSARLLERVDTVVAMSGFGTLAVRAALPAVAGARFVEIPHPHYRDFYGAAEAEPVRARLGIPETAHLTVAAGLVRRYKRIPALIAAFAAAARDDEWLLVAGPCHEPELRAEVERAAAAVPRVRLAIGALEDDAFAATLRAADLFVGNFEAVLNSGSVLAALSLDTPVLAPRCGVLAELQAQVGPAWLALFDRDLDGDELRWQLDAARAAVRQGRPDLGPNEPDAVVAAHLRLYT